jgi:hypothetical protein
MAVKNAEHVGRIKTEEELDAIRKANTRVYTNNYYEHQAIQLANQIAQQRNKEGRQIKLMNLPYQRQQHHRQQLQQILTIVVIKWVVDIKYTIINSVKQTTKLVIMMLKIIKACMINK